jgi:cardiolipin synthase
VIGRPVEMKPLRVSKLNTVAQIVFACVVLGSLAFEFNAGPLVPILMYSVAVLTFLSIAFYLADWIRHVGSADGDG